MERKFFATGKYKLTWKPFPIPSVREPEISQALSKNARRGRLREPRSMGTNERTNERGKARTSISHLRKEPNGMFARSPQRIRSVALVGNITGPKFFLPGYMQPGSVILTPLQCAPFLNAGQLQGPHAITHRTQTPAWIGTTASGAETSFRAVKDCIHSLMKAPLREPSLPAPPNFGTRNSFFAKSSAFEGRLASRAKELVSGPAPSDPFRHFRRFPPSQASGRFRGPTVRHMQPGATRSRRRRLGSRFFFRATAKRAAARPNRNGPERHPQRGRRAPDPFGSAAVHCSYISRNLVRLPITLIGHRGAQTWPSRRQGAHQKGGRPECCCTKGDRRLRQIDRTVLGARRRTPSDTTQ